MGPLFEIRESSQIELKSASCPYIDATFLILTGHICTQRRLRIALKSSAFDVAACPTLQLEECEALSARHVRNFCHAQVAAEPEHDGVVEAGRGWQTHLKLQTVATVQNHVLCRSLCLRTLTVGQDCRGAHRALNNV